jgi:arylsulfatase A-like enzyme
MFHRLAVIALILVSTAGSSFPATGQSKPNVIIIFTDDAGYSDFGFQGSDTHRTPRIDSLAANGITFTNGYVSASVCSPSRAGLLTGRYQQRFGHEYNLPGMADPEVTEEMRGMPVTELTIAALLKKAGYKTGMVGKWHLGDMPQFHPTERGFDEFFGMRGGGSSYHPGTAKAIESSYKEVNYVELPYLTDAFGDEACGFIERHRESPFFLYLSFNAPHTPMHARPDYLEEALERFQTEKRAINAAMTRSIDENVGKVLDLLDEHGLTENTLIFFLNDNGGAMPYNASLNDPLRGTKGTCLEGGNRVPFCVQWPARYPKGTTYDEPVISLDILPTALAAAGGSLPADRTYDGTDLTPFLTESEEGIPHQILFWKLNWGAAVRKGDWKLVRTPADEYWLFNLDEDRGEREDRLEELPEIATALKEELHAWEKGLPVPIWVSAPMWRKHSLKRYDQSIVDSFRKN